MFKKLKNKKIPEAEKLERKFEILKNRKTCKRKNRCTSQPYSFMTIDARPNATLVLQKKNKVWQKKNQVI